MGEIEFDGSATNGLEVDEERPARRVEHVAWVWLAMQHLLGGASAGDRQGHAAQRGAEKLAVGVGERGRLFGPRNELLRLGDSVREVGRDDIEVPQAGMQPLQGTCVVGRLQPRRCDRVVVRPEGDPEAVTFVDAMSNSRRDRGHRSLELGQPLSDLDFERRHCCVRRTRDAGEDVARHHAQGDPVRVVQNNGVVGREAELAGCQYGGSDGAPEL